MLYEVFGYGQRAGVVALEEEVENPGNGRLFSRYPEFLKDASLRDYLCDSLRMLVIGATTPVELDRLMGLDLDVQRRGAQEPSGALGALADSLPGLGIVAAVLGVVITMSSIGAAPESIGQKVAASLVGTFLGILLCYGVVGPFAARIEANTEERMQLLEIVRTAVAAYAHGASPILAAEYARRSIPTEMRPSFGEMEKVIRRDAKIPPVPDGSASGVKPPNAVAAA
jgi:chemotaxis protein MotA